MNIAIIAEGLMVFIGSWYGVITHIKNGPILKDEAVNGGKV